MSNKKLSLFDALIEVLTLELGTKTTHVLQEALANDHYHGTIGKADCHPGRDFAISALLPGLQKRYVGPTCEPGCISNEERERIAIEEFLEDNARCKSFNEEFDYTALGPFERTVWGEVIVLLEDALVGRGDCPLNLKAIAGSIHSGPGASSDVTGLAGSYGRLADGPMSFSNESVYHTYKACTNMYRLSYVSEAVRRQMFGDADTFNSVANFLSVLKTNKKNRGICTQPSGNMALQLATHDVLCGVLKTSFGCDLSTQQDHNRLLAYCGSLGQKSWLTHSWHWCTLDLSRASNFPLVLIQLLFPSVWSTWITHIRSHSIKIDGGVVEKHMCSSMGNGFTFSLMTVLLSAIVKVLYSLAGLPEYDVHPLHGRQKTWAVYGDDIIVDQRVFNALNKVLDAFGFLVNKKKTYSGDTLFRESCGADFYDGYPVRPVFVEQLQTQSDLLSLTNRLVRWGALHSVDLPETLKFLRLNIGKDVHRVPCWEDVTSGLHVPFECAVKSPVGVPKKISELLNKGNIPYTCLVPVAKRKVLFVENTRQVKYTDIATREVYSYSLTFIKKEGNNPAGIILHMLGGSVRNGRVGMRSLNVDYEEVWKIAPSWGDFSYFTDTAIQVRLGVGLFAYSLWERYLLRNYFLRKPPVPKTINFVCKNSLVTWNKSTGYRATFELGDKRI